ncbi:MAG: DoxX family protein [Rikenellaceae bacterium]
MEEKQKNIDHTAHRGDWTVLYLRIILGGVLLLHNVAKVQDYNVVIEAYHQLWGVGGATWYVAFSFIEVVCAFLLIMGRWVRAAAVVLILGTIMGMIIYFGASSPIMIELNSIYILLYLLLLITGGGYYSLDSVGCRRFLRKRVNNKDD